MIIKFPTGLYRDVLPVNPQDSGNVTFTISNTTPPRTNLVFPKIPAGLVDRGREQPVPVDQLTNRQSLGTLIFTISSAKRRMVGNNTRQFEIGQVLEFDGNSGRSVEPMLVSEVTEIQHNTNTFDYDSLGVTSDEQEVIAKESFKTHAALTEQLNGLKRKRADAEIEVNVQQKVINETNRTLSALEVIGDTSGDVAALIEKLKKRRADAFKARDKAINDANVFATEADQVLAKLRAVSVVLK